MDQFSWPVRIRWTAAAALAIVGALGAELVPSVLPLIAVAAAIAIYAFAFAHLERRVPAIVPFVCDALALTAYLHFSGDTENPLRFAYVLAAAGASLVISMRSGIIVAAICTGLFVLLVGFTWWASPPHRLPHYHLALFDPNLHSFFDPLQSPHESNYLLVQAFRMCVTTFGAALGFGVLGRRMRAREEELKVQHSRMRLLLDILPQGVLLLAKDGSVLLANRSAKEMIGRADPTVLEDLPVAWDVRRQLGAFDGPFREFETHEGNRTLKHVLARSSDEGPTVWLFRDTTEEQRMMAELMHRSKMADLGLLAAGIAHEIGNPLSSMAATLEMLELKGASEDVLVRLKPLLKHIDRIGQVVQDVRSFARPSPGNRGRVDACLLVEDALQIFRLHDRSRHVTIDAEPSPDLLPVHAVPDQIVQVVLNLLINAADACASHGKIRVRTQGANREIRISISDNGSGMDEETRRHVFAPFFTTKEPGKGTGLGLFVSEAIARSHGGRVEVESEKGRGSCFTLCLPRLSKG